MLAYRWPGNVRELRNAIERAVVLAASDRIEPEDLGIEPALPSGGLLKEVERRTILAVLQQVGGNRREAAKRLGISLRTLQYRLKEYSLSNEVHADD